MQGADGRHLAEVVQDFTTLRIFPELSSALWCCSCWLIDLKGLTSFGFLDALERCCSHAKLLFSWEAVQAACVTRWRESNSSPQGESNNSLFVVLPRQMLGIATLAARWEQPPIRDGILYHSNKTFYYAAGKKRMNRSPFFLQPQFGDWNLNQMPPSNKCQ